MAKGINEIDPASYRLLYDNQKNVQDNYKISIVTPNYNRGELLKNMLGTLVWQAFNPHLFEMVLVDDGGEAKEVDMIRQMDLPFRLRYYWQEHEGRRVGHVRNIGIKNATGEVIVFLDSDALASRSLLKDHYEKHKHHRRLVILGDMFDLKKGDSPVFRTLLGLDRTAMPLHKFMLHVLKREYILPFAYRLSRTPMGLCLCTLHASARREHLLAVNGFDEGLDSRWGDEDLELGYRLEKLGLRVRWSGSSFVYHQWHPIHFDVHSLDNRLKLFLRHPETLKIKKIGGLENPFHTWNMEEIRALYEREEADNLVKASHSRDSQLQEPFKILFDNRVGEGSAPEISLIVPTYNRRHFLEGFLDTVAAQSLAKEKFELILADDGGSDNSLEYVKSRKDPFRLIYIWQEDKGFRIGQSKNNAVSIAHGKIIVFTDVDAILPENFLEEHSKIHQKETNVLVAGLAYYLRRHQRLRPDNFRNGRIFQYQLAGLRLKLWIEKIRRCYLTHLAQQGQYALGTSASSIHCSFAKVSYEKTGGYDQDFNGLWGDEDLEFAHRLTKNGVAVRFLDTTIAYHRWHPYAPTRAFSDENRCLLLIKHQDLLKYRIINVRRNRYYNWSISQVRCKYLWAKRQRIMKKLKPESIRMRELKEYLQAFRRVLLPAFFYNLFQGNSQKRGE